MRNQSAIETIDAVIATIYWAKQRPAMYFSPFTVGIVEHWLAGVRAGLANAGILWNPDFHRRPLALRGLELYASSEAPRLAARGMNEHQIAEELLSIEMEMWQEHRNAIFTGGKS
jgi:hypothetical protein